MTGVGAAPKQLDYSRHNKAGIADCQVATSLSCPIQQWLFRTEPEPVPHDWPEGLVEHQVAAAIATPSYQLTRVGQSQSSTTRGFAAYAAAGDRNPAETATGSNGTGIGITVHMNSILRLPSTTGQASSTAMCAAAKQGGRGP